MAREVQRDHPRYLAVGYPVCTRVWAGCGGFACACLSDALDIYILPLLLHFLELCP